MKRQSEHKHIIDLLFPPALFFVLAASSIALVVLSSGFYSRQVEQSESGNASRTALSYVTEKLHQNDESDRVETGVFDGEKSLVIHQDYDGVEYITYLYLYDGFLRELFIKDGVSASASDGREILAVDSFDFEEVSPGLFYFSCTNEDGSVSDTYVSLKSQRNDETF